MAVASGRERPTVARFLRIALAAHLPHSTQPPKTAIQRILVHSAVLIDSCGDSPQVMNNARQLARKCRWPRASRAAPERRSNARAAQVEKAHGQGSAVEFLAPQSSTRRGGTTRPMSAVLKSGGRRGATATAIQRGKSCRRARGVPTTRADNKFAEPVIPVPQVSRVRSGPLTMASAKTSAYRPLIFESDAREEFGCLFCRRQRGRGLWPAVTREFVPRR